MAKGAFDLAGIVAVAEGFIAGFIEAKLLRFSANRPFRYFECGSYLFKIYEASWPAHF